MMENQKNEWRFKGNNFTTETGLDTSDMETFKKDPMSSLAREACQNSIDARVGDNTTVLIEFNSFYIDKESIPNRTRIYQEMLSCKDYQKRNQKIFNSLSDMVTEVNREKISCLRISDFNTTGLTGVSTNEQKAFYLLTKGSGLTDKVGTTGGSKGIGKYASFVASLFNTVFYSTYTIEGEEGHIGICKLCSTIKDKETGERTQGIGYYGSDHKNSPVLEQLFLQKGYERKTPGTDIYILGFKNEDSWKQEVITKILESFMSAIQVGELAVKVDDVMITKDTLGEIVTNETLILKDYANQIKSQYILLTDSNVYKKDIEVLGYGTATIYLKAFKKDESHLATYGCTMIRYPYMKIKEIRRISTVPCAAMCIIHNNNLNSVLRDIENPQHTDWEPRRISDLTIRKEVNSIIRELRDQIIAFAYEKLSSSENEEIDVEGAGAYLPDTEVNEIGNSSEQVITEKPQIIKSLRNKVKEKIGVTEIDEENALQPEIGNHEDGEGSPCPEGENEGSGGTPRDNPNELGSGSEGDNEILKITNLKGMQYRFFVTNKNNGEYVISFVSLYNENDCELEIFYLDDSNKKYKVDILDANSEQVGFSVGNGAIKNLRLKNGDKYVIKVKTDLYELRTCEVKIYANR